MTVHLPPEERPPHPAAFLILYLPFGIASGYISITLGYLLHETGGASVLQVSALVTLYIVPQTWKVLWAPIVDTTLTSKRWYVIAAVATGVSLIATAVVPAQASALGMLQILAVILSTASSLIAMSVERLMAHATPDHQIGRAGGWAQAGNLGGFGLGGGAGLYMAQHVAPWSAGASLGIFSLLCGLALLVLREPPERTESLHYGQSLINVGKDVWSIAYSRVGFLTLLLFFLPVGTGAASNLWSAIAGDWHADADTVALVNGLLGGIVAIPGSLIGGYLSDLMDRKTGYALFGVLLAALTAAMAVAPRTSEMFVVFTLGYSFLTGFTYASFCAVTLETIGKGAAATKYNLLACVSNVPIAYMTVIDGAAEDRWGSSGLLLTEAGLGVAAVLFFAAVALATRSRAAASVSGT